LSIFERNMVIWIVKNLNHLDTQNEPIGTISLLPECSSISRHGIHGTSCVKSAVTGAR